MAFLTVNPPPREGGPQEVFKWENLVYKTLLTLIANYTPMKTLTGTTAAAEGGTTNIAHGLDSTKILSVEAVVFSTATGGMIPGFINSAGLQFDMSFDATNVSVINHATNSENILSKPIRIVVHYSQ